MAIYRPSGIGEPTGMALRRTLGQSTQFFKQDYFAFFILI
jgi:hypothetical protein